MLTGVPHFATLAPVSTREESKVQYAYEVTYETFEQMDERLKLEAAEQREEQS